MGGARRGLPRRKGCCIDGWRPVLRIPRMRLGDGLGSALGPNRPQGSGVLRADGGRLLVSSRVPGEEE